MTALATALGNAYRRFLAGDPAPLLATLAEDVVYHLPGHHLGGGVLRGRTAVIDRLAAAAAWCAAPPHATLLEVVGTGPFVLTREHVVLIRGDTRLEQHAAVLWRFAHDRCVELRTVFDDQPTVDRFWASFTPDDPLRAELQAFFARYARAFDAADVDTIAACYHLPGFFAADGNAMTVDSLPGLREHLHRLLAHHDRSGYASATVASLTVTDFGPNLALGTVQWNVRDVGGNPLWQFDVTYNLIRHATAWHMIAATTHTATASGTSPSAR